jgi:hypothetical protein
MIIASIESTAHSVYCIVHRRLVQVLHGVYKQKTVVKRTVWAIVAEKYCARTHLHTYSIIIKAATDCS